jgi:DNA-binding protein YbaB
MLDNPDLTGRLDLAIGQLEKLADFRTQLDEVSAVGEAAEGLVRVQAGPSGHPTSLTIDPRAMRMDSESLSEAIMEAFRDARDKTYQQLRGLTDALPQSMDLAGVISGRSQGGGADASATIRRTIEKLREMRG